MPVRIRFTKKFGLESFDLGFITNPPTVDIFHFIVRDVIERTVLIYTSQLGSRG